MNTVIITLESGKEITCMLRTYLQFEEAETYRQTVLDEIAKLEDEGKVREAVRKAENLPIDLRNRKLREGVQDWDTVKADLLFIEFDELLVKLDEANRYKIESGNS